MMHRDALIEANASDHHEPSLNFLGPPVAAFPFGADGQRFPSGMQLLGSHNGDHVAQEAAARDVEAALGVLAPINPRQIGRGGGSLAPSSRGFTD